MKTINRVAAIAIMVILCCSIVGVAEVMPRADINFESASAFLASNKSVVFDCTLYAVYKKISITNVWLEQQVDGEWGYIKGLTPPAYVAENMADYGAVCYYTNDIGTGTFRVGFTVNADGYSISRYSNSRTF